MVIAEAVAGAAAGAHALWDYNRDNFLYDRKMRQETELKVLEWRSEQSELWREDIRDIIGLTEKKMGSYLIVSTLQLGMCLGLFTEGRLEPGTPPWLIHFYSLTLSAAFMYLLMSIWMAVHASIVAQCSAVRLLTQFVRLPIPSWQVLQNMRTFASSYEHLETDHMMRVPFTRNPAGAKTSDPVDGLAAPDEASHSENVERGEHIDPWKLEDTAEDLYELEHIPASLRRHVCLARRAGKQYQSYDAFARVSMAFGTNQLLHAICYYVLGYVALQDGAPWAAFCVIALMLAIGVALVQLDFSMTPKEKHLARILFTAGPVAVASATFALSLKGAAAEPIIMILLPMAYASHGLWLFFALIACGLELQKSGAILPQKFRAVLYMDVFGMLRSKSSNRSKEPPQFAREPFRSRFPDGAAGGFASMASSGPAPPAEQDTERTRLRDLRKELKADLRLWRSSDVQRVMEEEDRERADLLLERAHEAMAEDDATPNRSSFAPSRAGSMETEDRFVKLHGYTDFGNEVPYLYNPRSGEARMLDSGDAQEETARSSSSAGPQGSSENVRTMTALEGGIDKYCVAKEEQKRAAKAKARRLPPQAFARSRTNHFLDAAAAAMTPVVKALLPEHESEDQVEDDFTNYAHLRAESVDTDGSPSPSGEVHGNAATFDPASYTPHAGLDYNDGLGPDEEIVTGHDKMEPGRLPAKVFRMATMLLVSLWAVGLMLPFGVFREFMTTPMMATIPVEDEDASGLPEHMEAVIGTQPDGLPELIPIDVKKDLPWLGKGEKISAEWPHGIGFTPQSLSSDPSGKALVVADDLGVYVGRIDVDIAEDKATGSLQPSSSLRFQRVPPCSALEGQHVQDISVTCEPDSGKRCRVVVLHAQGSHLAECPLPISEDTGIGKPLAAMPVTEPEEWLISTSWLHDDPNPAKSEAVKALATNSDCVNAEHGSGFQAEFVGCVVVGTSEGRIVQLRGAFGNPRRLVPERAMQQRTEALTRGSLHAFFGYVMVLRHNTKTLQAFDSKTGSSVGEWNLPKGPEWVTIGGGGGMLFLLARENGTSELYKFPVPPELPEAREAAATSFGLGLRGESDLQGPSLDGLDRI